ncbi:YitT family protein [Chitinimonas naiadis]
MAVVHLTSSRLVSSHSVLEDVQALLIGCLFVALSVLLLRQAHVLTGGTAGLAFLGHYASGLPFGVLFFLINLPFYVFAYLSLGRRFTMKTLAAVSLLSLFTECLPSLINIQQLDPLFAALLGGLLAGTGLLMLIRHQASLGGLGVMAIYLQEKHGLRAGKTQLACDTCIIFGAISLLDLRHMVLSVLGAIAMNAVIAINQKPGRYAAF